MDIGTFKSEVIYHLSALEYIDEIELYEVDEYSVRGIAKFKKSYILTIRFRNYHSRLTLSFTLLFEGERIWGLDKDNRIGWHIHPIDDTGRHEPLDEKSISEIVEIFDAVMRRLL